jgi:bacterioferritin (cytochrome b1)
VTDEERLDVEEALTRLNTALALQQRSVLQYSLTSGSLLGFELQAVGDRLMEFARAELEDARRVVEKVVALGGEPTTDVAPLRFTEAPEDAIGWLVKTESEAVDRLKDAIGPTGREGRSEALEHMLEHLIVRKQTQVDFLQRAARRTG